MSLYRLDKVRRVYGGRTVLDVERLEIGEGVVTAVLGPNGAGKTTLFSILAFLEPPTSGGVRFRGNPVSYGRTPLRELRREAVLIPQNPAMFTTTVKRNMEFGLKLRGVERRERERRILEALDMVGMRDYLHARAHRLSGGETQRVALARALALRASVILCDEPAASVDVENQAVIFDLLRWTNAEQGTTVLFTSHDLPWARGLAHRVVHLLNGRMAGGAPENLYMTRVRPGDGSANGAGAGPHCLLAGRVCLPAPGRAEGPSVLRIDPSGLGLLPPEAAGEQPEDGTVRLAATVREIRGEADAVWVGLDAGFRVGLRLRPEEYQSRAVAVGDRVTLEIPPAALSWN